MSWQILLREFGCQVVNSPRIPTGRFVAPAAQTDILGNHGDNLLDQSGFARTFLWFVWFWWLSQIVSCMWKGNEFELEVWKYLCSVYQLPSALALAIVRGVQKKLPGLDMRCLAWSNSLKLIWAATAKHFDILDTFPIINCNLLESISKAVNGQLHCMHRDTSAAWRPTRKS